MAAARVTALAAAALVLVVRAQVVNQINVTAGVLSGGFPTAGGATVIVGADNLPLGQPLHMTMRSPVFPGDLTCGCALLGSPTSSTPGMSMVRFGDRKSAGRRPRGAATVKQLTAAGFLKARSPS